MSVKEWRTEARLTQSSVFLFQSLFLARGLLLFGGRSGGGTLGRRGGVFGLLRLLRLFRDDLSNANLGQMERAAPFRPAFGFHQYFDALVARQHAAGAGQ